MGVPYWQDGLRWDILSCLVPSCQCGLTQDPRCGVFGRILGQSWRLNIFSLGSWVIVTGLVGVPLATTLDLWFTPSQLGIRIRHGRRPIFMTASKLIWHHSGSFCRHPHWVNQCWKHPVSNLKANVCALPGSASSSLCILEYCYICQCAVN